MPRAFRAYAKINLGLAILRKRPDGYHDIETVFHRIDLFDELEFLPSESISVESNDPAAPGDETNLCYRSADLLRRHAGVAHGVRIRLKKSIPVGAGLGGGSSDAAAVLKHLPRFWGIGVAEPVLSELAGGLGSDVPYFLGNLSARAHGRGEILDYFLLDLPYTILTCTPPVYVSTAWAYREVSLSTRPELGDFKETVLKSVRDPARLADLWNDFEEPVFRAHPEIQGVRDSMREHGSVRALLSGSGSSVFGLFNSPERASRAAQELTKSGNRVWITPPHFQPG